MQREIKYTKTHTPTIGATMWIGGYPMLEYVVTAEIQREKNTQYELECQSCTHGSKKCRLLITKNDYGDYVYIAMLNEDDEYDDRQYYFHRNNGNFYLTKEEAEIEKINRYIADCNKSILESQEKIQYQETRKAEMQDRLKQYTDLLTLSP